MATRCSLGARPTAEDPDGSVCMRPNPHSKGYAGWALSWRWWRSLSAERPSHRPRRWLGPWPLAVPTRASPQCLTRTHAPQSGCMTVLGYRCTAFNWGAISRPQASYTGLHPTDARSKSEYSLTHSLTHSGCGGGGQFRHYGRCRRGAESWHYCLPVRSLRPAVAQTICHARNPSYHNQHLLCSLLTPL